MKKIISRTLTSIFLFVFLCSCSTSASQPKDIAASIEITYQPSSTIKRGSDLDVWLKNTTKYCLEFPAVDGMKVYAQQKERWVEIPNLVTVIGNQIVKLKPAGDFWDANVFTISPDLASLNSNEPIKFRAVLTGYLCEDHTIVIEKEIPFTVTP